MYVCVYITHTHISKVQPDSADKLSYYIQNNSIILLINVSLMLALASLFIKNVHTTSALFYSSTKMGIQEFQAVNGQTPRQIQIT